jgi:hypothetical protein
MKLVCSQKYKLEVFSKWWSLKLLTSRKIQFEIEFRSHFEFCGLANFFKFFSNLVLLAVSARGKLYKKNKKTPY